jgi:hypothetical protein
VTKTGNSFAVLEVAEGILVGMLRKVFSAGSNRLGGWVVVGTSGEQMKPCGDQKKAEIFVGTNRFPLIS